MFPPQVLVTFLSSRGSIHKMSEDGRSSSHTTGTFFCLLLPSWRTRGHRGRCLHQVPRVCQSVNKLTQSTCKYACYFYSYPHPEALGGKCQNFSCWHSCGSYGTVQIRRPLLCTHARSQRVAEIKLLPNFQQETGWDENIFYLRYVLAVFFCGDNESCLNDNLIWHNFQPKSPGARILFVCQCCQHLGSDMSKLFVCFPNWMAFPKQHKPNMRKVPNHSRRAWGDLSTETRLCTE